MRKAFYITASIFSIAAVLGLQPVYGQTTMRVSPIAQKATIFASPAAGTFLENTTFEVPIFINTHGRSINAIELYINFDPKKLSIVRPSGGQSIIAIWVEPPSYSNTAGNVKLVGTIPNGITTESGLITVITFKAISTGNTSVSVSQTSKVLANDGQGTEVQTVFGRGNYSLIPRPPEGVKVFSETHPFSDRWYNNNNPIVGWEKDPGITDFSFALDNKPFTVPDNVSDTQDTATSFENQPNGIYYFHIKAKKGDKWGSATHFPLRIDTNPPAAFTPRVETLLNPGSVKSSRAIVSFFTTDDLSGIAYYEVGIIDKNSSPDVSPVFVQTESPYQLPLNVTNGSRVIVRAVDLAGNATDHSADIHIPFFIGSFIQKNITMVLGGMFLITLLLILLHYLFGHRTLAHLIRAFKIAHDEELRTPVSAIPNPPLLLK